MNEMIPEEGLFIPLLYLKIRYSQAELHDLSLQHNLTRNILGGQRVEISWLELQCLCDDVKLQHIDPALSPLDIE